MKNFWRLLKVVGFTLLITTPQITGAMDYVRFGQGRYLTEPERREFLECLPITGSKVAIKKYAEALEIISNSTNTEANIDVMEFTKLEWLAAHVKHALKETQRVYLVCFSCYETVSSHQNKITSRANSIIYDIWGVSGHFIVLEKDIKSEK
jgi:hypothetical protein